MPQHNLQNQIDLFYENYQGAEDLRTNEEKARDFNQNEIVAEALPVDWRVKSREEFRGFPELDQFYTSKCVAFTIAKLAMINFWLKTKEMLKFSPNSIYNYRSNKPSGGMVGDDAFNIWESRGISLEAVAKSDQVLEADPYEITLLAQEIAKGFRLGRHITINNGEFDRVASTIQVTGKGVMSWFYFTNREWSLEIPRVLDALTNPSSLGSLRHSVTVVDFGILDGQEVLKIEDSAHFGNISVRYVTREFFNARNFLNKYPMHFNYENPEAPVTPKPIYTFTKNLTYGMTNNPDVRALQNALRFLGYFPINADSSGGYFNITSEAVLAWQLANKIDTPQALNALQGKSFGPKSRSAMNLLLR